MKLLVWLFGYVCGAGTILGVALLGPMLQENVPALTEEGRHFAKAKEAISGGLFDPYSARFENLKIQGKFVCGYVNAKNRMGAYAGRVPFTYNMETGVAFVLNDKKEAFVAGAENVIPCFPWYHIPSNAMEASRPD